MTKAKDFVTIYVLTHCESYYNERGIFSGRANSVLTKRGHQHAEQLANQLKKAKIGLAYISPLTRTKETLKHILKYHPNVKVLIDKRIIERDYGRLTRKSKAKYAREHPDLFPIYHRSYEVAPPDGESMKHLEQRVLLFVKDVVKLAREKKTGILVVCHGNSIRPIRRYFEGLSINEMMRLEHSRCKIFKYKVGV